MQQKTFRAEAQTGTLMALVGSVVLNPTRLFVGAVVAVAAVVCVWAVGNGVNSPPTSDQWLAFGVFAVFAAGAQALRVPGLRQQLFQTAIAFFFAGIVLLGPALLAVLVLVSLIPEWIRFRYPWHMLAFKVGSLLIATVVGRYILEEVTSALQALPLPGATVIAAAAAALFFVGVCHVLLLAFLRLTRGTRFAESGSLAASDFVTITDIGVLCLGGIVAVLWHTSPWLILLAFPPLFVAHRAFSVPVLREEARLDPKTGLLNAKYVVEALEAELRRAVRFRRPMAVIMGDLDLMRDVNNTYGHLAGDVVLRGVADSIGKSVRECDMAARFGGEEFTIVLPETTAEQAMLVAERIRKNVEAARFEVPNGPSTIGVRISLGVAAYPSHGITADQLVHQADMAVYTAKRNGRNQSCMAPPHKSALSESDKLAEGTERSRGQDALSVDQAYILPGDPHQASRLHGASDQPAGLSVPVKEVAERPARSRAAQLSRPVITVIASLGLAYLVSAVLLAPGLVQSDLVGLALFSVLAVVSERYGVSLYGDSRVSISFVFVMGAAIVFGASGVLAVGSILAVSLGLMRGHAPHKIVFNLGSLVLAALAAALIYHSFRIPLQPANTPYLFLAAFAGAVANYLVNTWSVALVISLTTHQGVVAVWQEKFRWLFIHYAVLGLLSLLVAIAYSSLGLFGVLAFLVPPVMMRYSMKQYVDRTVETVAALKQANEELEGKNREISEAFRDLHETYDATLVALSTALDSRDSDTEGHSRRVVAYSRTIAKAMKLPEATIKQIEQGALLHDVGKIGVSDAVLLKRGPLNGQDWAEMRRHPVMGVRILSGVRFLGESLSVVRYHHEKYDGSGYPDGLAGDQIPLGARIFAVADAFDAITSDRPYRRGRSCKEARQEIARCAGGHFDPAVVDAFLRVSEQEWLHLREQSLGASGGGRASRPVRTGRSSAIA